MSVSGLNYVLCDQWVEINFVLDCENIYSKLKTRFMNRVPDKWSSEFVRKCNDCTSFYSTLHVCPYMCGVIDVILYC